MSQPPGFPPHGGSPPGPGGDEPWGGQPQHPWGSPPNQSNPPDQPWGQSAPPQRSWNQSDQPQRSWDQSDQPQRSWDQPATQSLNQPDPGRTQVYPATPPPGGTEQLPADGDGPLGPRRTPRNTKKIGIIVGASVLALVLVVIGAVLFRNYQAQVAEERAAEAARKAEEERQAEQVRQQSAAGSTAQGFLEAITESDAEKALTFAATPPEGNNELLTREVLTEANTRAAMTAVTVDETTLTEESPGVWNGGTAKVRYSIGDQPQTVDLPLRKVDGQWKVDRVAASVELGLNGPDRVVNGATVRPGAYNLFPGAYSVTSPNPLVGLDRTEFVLTSPVDPETDWSPTPVLSDEGRAKTVESAKRLVDDCLKVRELAPANCPFIRWREDGLTIDPATIRYTLKNDPWKDIDFRFNGATMTASSPVTITHEIQASATKNGQRGTLVPAQQTAEVGINVKLGTGTPEASFT